MHVTYCLNCLIHTGPRPKTLKNNARFGLLYPTYQHVLEYKYVLVLQDFGWTSNEMQLFRDELRPLHLKLKHIKNSIMRVLLKDMKLHKMIPLFTSSVHVMYFDYDGLLPVALSLAEEMSDRFVLMGGLANDTLYTPRGLAELPRLPQARKELVETIEATAHHLLTTLSHPANDLTFALVSRKDGDKQGEGGGDTIKTEG